MTVSEVLALLDAERDERGMSNWEKLGSSTSGMRSYGIGLTRLRKLARRIGRDRELAHALWKTDVYEARVIALLVDDPARITREQAENQVEELAGGMLAYVFASATQRSQRRHLWSSLPTTGSGAPRRGSSSWPMSSASRTRSGRSRRRSACLWARR